MVIGRSLLIWISITLMAVYGTIAYAQEQLAYVDVYGMRVEYGGGLECRERKDKGDVLFHFPGDSPLGMLGVTKLKAMTSDAFEGAMRKNSKYQVVDAEDVRMGDVVFCHVYSLGIESPFISDAFCIKKDGVFLNYIGPPENYHHFKHVIESVFSNY